MHRPNHGLIHTFRVMLYITYVVDYFAHHAKDPLFRKFCQNLSKDLVNWLRITAAYLVTGRESEIGFRDDNDRYKKYKAASATHFRKYVKQENPLPFQEYSDQENPQEVSYERDKKSIEEIRLLKVYLAEVIQHRGDPVYLEQIRQEKIPEEVNRFSSLQYILSMAHNLDLARCSGALEYQESVASHDHIIEPCDEQRASLKSLQYFAINLMKAHGDNPCCEFNEKGELVDAVKCYEPKFGRFSHSIKELIDETATVSAPEIFPAEISSVEELDSELPALSASPLFFSDPAEIQVGAPAASLNHVGAAVPPTA